MSDASTSLTKAFSNGPVELELRAPDKPAIARALTEGKPFPPGTVELGAVEGVVKGGRKATLGGGKGKAEFGGSVEVGGRFGVYGDGNAALEALAIDASAIGGLSLKRVTGRRYAAMEWKYRGEANGSIAMDGGATVRIGGEAKTHAQYAVIRLLDPKPEPAAVDVIADVVGNWVLPRAISTAADLAPGTWVVTDVAGSLGVNVGVQYGLSLDWIRESSLRGLSGDMGLKIKAGIDASLGFQAAGRFLTVVARESTDESEERVRVRVFKRKRRGIEFSLNAGATLKPVNDGFLPESFDAFLAGVLGIDGKQLMGSLEDLRTWTDPKQVAENLLGLVPEDLVAEEVESFLRRLLPQDKRDLGFKAAKREVLKAVDRWAKLDHEVAALLWSKIGDVDEIEHLRTFAAKVKRAKSDAADAEARIRALLERVLGAVQVDAERPEEVGVDTDAALAWVREVTGAENLAELLDPRAIKKIGTAADQLLDVLDGDAVEGTVSQIHEYVSEKLRIETIRSWVESADLEQLDPWLRGRLEAFLEDKLSKVGLTQLQKLIDELEAKKDELYGAITDALKREYGASLQLAYESASESTALVDVTIDTSQRDGPELLQQAIAGRFDKVFGTGSKALAVGVGELTHGVRTRLDASLTLPFSTRSVKKLTRSVAKMRVEAGGGSEVRIYSLDAENIVEYNNKIRSELSVAGIFASKSSAFRVWSEPKAVSSYQFEIAKEKVLRPRLEQLLRPLVDAYFAEKFAPVPGEPSGLSAWLSDLDRTVEDLEQNGADRFGNVVIRLSVSIPAPYLAAWTKAPERPEAPLYRELSVAMQKTMRRVLVSTLTSDTDFVKARGLRLAGLLGYASIRADWGAGFDRSRNVEWRRFESIHWAFHDLGLLRAVVTDRETVTRLWSTLTVLHPALAAEGSVKGKTLKRLEPDNVVELVKTIRDQDIADLSRGGLTMGTLQSLLWIEREAIQAAIEAGRAAARFHRLKEVDSEGALQALSEFGARLTRAFNEKLSDKLWRRVLPALSTELFMAAARCFDPELSARGNAVLELFVIDKNTDFPPKDLAAIGATDTNSVILQQRVVGNTR